MSVVLLIVSTVIGVSLLWAVTTALVGRLAGATVLKVSLALGPSLRIARFGSTEVRLGLPIGSAVRFLDAEALSESFEERSVDEVDETTDLPADRRLLEQLPFAARLLIQVAGWLAVFLFATVALGLSNAASELGQGFAQIVRFFSEPAYPAMALGSLQAELSAGRWLAAAAVVATKMMALNLLPLPILAGGQILQEIASAVLRRPVRWPGLLVSISFGFYLVGIVFFVEKVWKALPSL